MIAWHAISDLVLESCIVEFCCVGYVGSTSFEGFSRFLGKEVLIPHPHFYPVIYNVKQSKETPFLSKNYFLYHPVVTPSFEHVEGEVRK
jgi:hypothetical protein